MAGKIKIKQTVLFDGDKGWEHNGLTYRLACGPILTQAPNGDLMCVWLTGTDMEPATDNCMAIARSSDRGKTWSETEIFVPASKDGAGGGGIIRVNDKLIRLHAIWPAEKKYTEYHYSKSESYDNGYTWTDPVPFKFIDEDNSSLGPIIKTSDGRLLCAAQVFKKRDNPLVAGAERLAFAKTEEEAAAMSPRVEGETDPDKFGTHLHCSYVFELNEDFTEFKMLGGVDNRPLGLLEPAIIELKSGRLVMLLRAEFGGYLWRSDSDDGGKTWCDAYQTDIKNPTTLATITRLPDGRIALFHNDNGGVVGKCAVRDPLSIWISNDEMESWYIKENVATGGNFSYPTPLILDNGNLVFTYDLNRRQTVFVEVEIEE